ncbi:MAG: zinc-dependent metalloprotease [Bacteroidaceae bacterium]|nr:zinc-dependent metalloprotease [Bacteroidaceae bacterium]
MNISAKALAFVLLLGWSANGAMAQDAPSDTTKVEKKDKKDSKKDKKAKKPKKQSEYYWKREPGTLQFVRTKREKPAAPPVKKPDIDRPGLFNVTKMGNDWFFEIPEKLIGKDILTTTRFISTPSNSGKFGGEEINEQTVYFQVVNKERMFLRARLIVNVADTANIINKAVTISNENPVLAQFKIENYDKAKKLYKIKVNEFLNDDNVVTGLNTSAKRSFNIGGMMGQLTNIEDIKSFPMNTEVRLLKTYASQSTSMPSAAETGRVTFGINVSFIQLPENPLLPRYYDPRVGYFTVGYNEFTDQQQRVKKNTFISRWRLEPKDEDMEAYKRGELVEPKKPIVYYIDPATPKQWRKYLIQGVNDWQSAFEKAGFKNAIYALEWPEGNDSIMSMEDARYSMIRYLASPIENAYGPHVSDPRTGEILESHICWYHNVMSLVHDWYMVQASSIDEAARKMKYDEELMGQLIRFVSSHEVGHTLGLRHNFGSSSTVPVDSLRNKAWVEAHGHTPSIMDYARFNYVAQPEDGISHEGIFPRINDYDDWAIRWGYTVMPDAKTSEEDHEALEALCKKYLEGNKRLWWGDGEGLRGTDPRRQTEDLGDDAVKASEYGIKNLKRELDNLAEWTYEKTDMYNQNLTQVYNQIRSQFLRYAGHVAGNIGGTYVDFKTVDQPGEIFRPNPKANQKKALDYFNRHLLTEPVWLRNMKYASRMTDDTQELTLPIASNAVALLLNRFSGLNGEYKAGEYLDDLTALIMKDAVNGAKVTRYRAQLQDQYVRGLISLNQNTNSSISGYALRTLKQLKNRIANVNGGDADSQAHFAKLNDMIQRALVIK